MHRGSAGEVFAAIVSSDEKEDAQQMVAPPSGTLTFLFTDIEGSTRLWERDATAMRSTLNRHDEILSS
jgi:class 3 adenylate cyclase